MFVQLSLKIQKLQIHSYPRIWEGVLMKKQAYSNTAKSENKTGHAKQKWDARILVKMLHTAQQIILHTD